MTVCGLATCAEADVRAVARPVHRRVARRVHAAARRVPRRRRVRPRARRRRRRPADRGAALVAGRRVRQLPAHVGRRRRESPRSRSSTGSARRRRATTSSTPSSSSSSATARTCGTCRCRSTARTRGRSRCSARTSGATRSLRSSAVALGGDYARLRSESRLDGQGAESDLLAVYFGDGTQMLDFRTLQDHAAPQHAQQPAVQGRGRGRGPLGVLRARAPPAARRTGPEAYQTNRNLVLTEGARRRVDPEPRDRGQRRAVLAREHRRPDRRRPALLPREPRHPARQRPSGSSSSASSTTCSTACRCARWSAAPRRPSSARSSTAPWS